LNPPRIADTARSPHTRGMRDVLTLLLNGENRQFETSARGPLSVLGLLTELGLDMRKVAVERNEEIVPRSRYAETWLASGDQLEIVHFIGGG
jgi:thiazole synthase/sulfur carrier protein